MQHYNILCITALYIYSISGERRMQKRAPTLPISPVAADRPPPSAFRPAPFSFISPPAREGRPGPSALLPSLPTCALRRHRSRDPRLSKISCPSAPRISRHDVIAAHSHPIRPADIAAQRSSRLELAAAHRGSACGFQVVASPHPSAVADLFADDRSRSGLILRTFFCMKS